MALATQADVEARLGRVLNADEHTRIDSLIDDASATVVGYCRQDFEAPTFTEYPVAVVGVVAKMAARALGRAGVGEFTEQQNAGAFGVRYSTTTSTGDVWLTAADKLALRPYRKGGGVVGVLTVSDRYKTSPDTY